MGVIDILVSLRHEGEIVLVSGTYHGELGRARPRERLELFRA